VEFSELAKVLASIESTTQRTAMVKLLVGLFKRLEPAEIDKAIYIILGDLRPPWEGLELGLGEKLCIRALARASGAKADDLEELYKRTGDMGETARRALSRRQAQTLLAFAGGRRAGLSVAQVYDTLLKVAKASGEGSQDLKVSLLSSLFSQLSPDEAKYVARFVVGRLRLGVADMTLIDALAEAFDVPEDALERAYNVRPDLGLLGKLVPRGGRLGWPR